MFIHGTFIHKLRTFIQGEHGHESGSQPCSGENLIDLIWSEQSEEQLIDRGLKGDARALDALFARNTRALYQTAFRVLGNPEDAEEALQEGLLSAYRNLPRFERRSQFSTWLTRIVINAALMRRRSKRSRPAVSLDDVASPRVSFRWRIVSPMTARIPNSFMPEPNSAIG